LPRNTFINADTNVKTSILYLKKKEKGDEQGNVFMAIIDNVGHNDAGKKTENLNELHNLLKLFQNFEKGKLEETDKTFITSGDEINDRLDCYSYAPKYKFMMKEIQSKEKNGDFDLTHTTDLNIIEERIKKKEYDKIKTDNFKYIELGGTDKDLGLILEVEEDLLINLPARAKQRVQTNDILIPTPIGSTEGIVKVPKEFNNQLCSTGFIIIRPKDEDEALLLWAIMKSNLVQKQFFYKQSGSLQPAITIENFKEMVLIPMPKDKLKNKIIQQVKEDIKDATDFKDKYGISLDKARNILKESIL